MSKFSIHMSAALLLLVCVGISQAETFITTPSGLRYKDLKIGSGLEAQLDSTVVIHFIGWLDENGQQGKEIYNSRKEKQPVSFVVGTNRVMQGWNEGVLGMRPGGTRMLRIPPELGYGAKAVDDVIPPNAPMLFVIELLEVK